ncbi:unnamed protein product [Prorocentrum cordatum]|uniref:RNA-directed RNA polymerase n=1 Tax=Prorocentrum cordatum TaxID=2364126 RepID=A0ABN9UPQ5_9DINO|nr:unnamed protein product [Polarella glacialis]
MAARTLDVPERQILVDFFDDPNGFRWHMRLLVLATPNPGQWICSTPDLSIQFIDVTTHRVIPLTRDSEFPRRVRGEVCAFDPLTPEELQQVRREAKELLAVYGLTGAADAQPEGGRWLIADPAHPGFGDALPAAALADGDSPIIRGDRGLACVGEDWIAVERVLGEDLDNWRLLKSTGAGRDRRILGDERVNGAPVLTLTAAARASSKALRPGWPFRGDACAPELVMALVAAGIVFIARHLDWGAKSGVGTTSGVCRTHRRICEGLDQAICYDQLDFANCAVIEHLARWLYEVESAVRRRSKVPDFTNLDGIFAAPMAEDGRMQLPTFSKWQGPLARGRPGQRGRFSGDACLDIACCPGAPLVALSVLTFLVGDLLVGGGPDVSYGTDEPGGPTMLVTALGQIPPRTTAPSRVTVTETPSPIPLSGEVFARGGHAGPASRSRVRCVREAIWSLNALDAPSRTLRAHQPSSSRRLTEAQRSIISRVSRRIENYGERPDILPATAYADLIKSHDLYSGQPMNLKPYDPDLLKVLHRDRHPQVLRGCLGSEGRRYLDNADELIFRTEAELGAFQESEMTQPITPYWDPILKNNCWARIDFIKRLASVGLVGFRLSIRGRIGAFCVGKKDGSLRLALDGREPSSLHRRPPHAALGSAGALAGLDLSDQALRSQGVDPLAADIHAAGLDLKDGFYQFANDDLADWFGFNYPEAASDFGDPLVHIHADGRFVQVSSDTRIFAEAQCKGLLSLGCDDGSRLVHERCPAPLLAPGRPLPQPYVDNANVIGLNFRDTEHALRGIQHVLDYLGIDYHDQVEPTKLYTTVGVVLDTTARRLRHTEARAWRFYFSLEHLLRVRRASGRALRVVYGHLVNHFMILRPALSALDEGYRFVAQHLDERAPLGRHLLGELRVVKGLLLLADVDLAAPWSRVVYCSDASGGELRDWTGWPFAVAGNGGCALHETACADYEVMQAFKYRERWRFKMEEEELVAPGAPSDGIRGWTPEPTATSDLLIAGLLAPCSKPSVIDRRLPRTRTVIVQGAVPALGDSLLVRSRWKMIVRGAFRYRASIHVKEARTQLLGLVRASRDPRMHGLRVGSLGDNMAALLSFEKGRARDKALLQLCRVSAARQIGCEIQCIESANAGLAADPPGPPARVRRPAPGGPAAGLSPGEAPRRDHVRRRAFCELYAGTGRLTAAVRLFSSDPLMDFLKASGGNWALLHYCQDGCAYKKPTYLASSPPEITSLERLCPGSHSHEILQGKASLASPSGAIRSHWKTSLAGAYPPELCRRWARLLAACAPRGARCAHAGDPLSGDWDTELAAGFPGGGIQLQRPQPSCPAGSPPDGAPPGPALPPLAGRRRAGAHAAESVGVRRRERAVGADRPYLKHQRAQPRTVSLYREARRKFSLWATEQHLRQVPMGETDLAMTKYLDHQYFQGLSIAHARNAVHGAIFAKDYPRRSPTTMYRAKDSLAGWFKAGPDRVRYPMPWEAAVLMADNLAERDREGVAAAGALLVSFDGCVRPSSALAITSREVSQRQAGSNPNCPSLVATITPQADDHGQQPAPSTKSGDHDCTIVFGDQASLKANRGICRDALLWASRKARRGRLLFDISLAKYEQFFNQAVADVKLGSLRVTPHCARHGGPSTDAALKLRPLEAIQKRGLWRSASSVRRYEKHGTLMRQISKMTSSQLRSVPAALRRLQNVFKL